MSSGSDDPKVPAKSRKELARERAATFIGRVISDRYRIEELIAVGGMGCVYRGTHVHMRKRVAIKLLLPDMEGLPDLVARFQREAVAGAHINHPNVAAATDFGTLEDGAYFLILEYVNGITLHDLIKQGALPPVRAVRVARQIAAALDASHQMGVVHRDLKPRNVMVDEGERDLVKVIDFGLAKVPLDRVATADVSAQSARGAITGVGVVLGTVAYMAPEAAFGMESVNERSDIYAMGILLYEMLAGLHPFDGQDSAAIFQQHRTQPPPPIRVRAPGVDVAPRLEAVVMRMLQKDPGDRFESARAVISALDAAMPSAAIDIGGPVIPSGVAPGRLAGSIGQSPSIVTVLPITTAEGGSAILSGASTPGMAESATSGIASGAGGAGVGAAGAGVAGSDVAGPRPPDSPMRTSDPGRSHYVPKLASRPSRSGGPTRLGLVLAGVLGAALAFSAAFYINQRNKPETTTPGPATATATGTGAATGAVTATGTATGTGAATGAAAGSGAPTTASATALASASADAATTVASATPAASVNNPPVDSSALQTALRDAVAGKAWRKGADTLIALAESNPKAFNDRDIILAAAMVASNLELGAREKIDDVFNALSTKAGSGGADVLYEIMSTRGRSSVAARSTELLRRKDVLDQATPALRIALELRDAACKDKVALLDRAKTDGDLRAVAVLDIFRSSACNPRVGQCCFRQNPQVEEAVRTIRARLRPAP